MNSRITKLAAAAVLALAILLLARHLTGQEKAVTPRDTIAHAPQNEGVPVRTAADQELEQSRLAQRLFAQADVKGLLQLLDTGLDQTKIAVAGYLAQVGDESVLPALQKLADQWRGPADDNPFRKSIEQIRNRSSRQDKADTGSQSRQEAPATPPAAANSGLTITVHVSEKATGDPIPNAAIRFWVGKSWQTTTGDDKGVFVLDLGESVPNPVMISVSEEGYVGQLVSLRNLSKQKLPKTIEFSLNKGTVIGGVVQDSAGHPIKGVSVESHIQEPQKFDQPHVNVSIKETTDDEGRWHSTCVPAQINRLWFNVHHAQFADGGFEMPKDLKLDDLRAERAVMVLKEGIAVAGRVADAAGNPIAGADLLAGEDYFARDWTKTDAAGRFEFPHLRTINAAFLLTVQAKGFAPQRKELPSEKGLAPVEFVLQPAKLLLGRVVDGAGHPVEGAFVTTGEWNRYRTVKWQGRTDAKGVFVWDYPPADAIQITINKAGYKEIRPSVIANDQEQTFVLAKPMTIQGSVTDSQTGQPVSRFKMTPGIHWGDGSNRATWQSAEGWVKWFTDGRYSYTFSSDGLAYAVRIEADGYMPAESRFVDAHELQATIDVVLSKDQGGPCGYVFDANVRPVAGAEVFWEKSLQIENGQAANKQSRLYTQTDNDGRFAFKADNRKDPLVVLCEQGMGVVSYEKFARSGIITLTPWARVQGNLRVGRQPGANKTLWLRYPNSRVRILEDLFLSPSEKSTDDSGRFVFERVCPGEFVLYNQTYEVAPGQTLELHLGGTGRTVKGEFAKPDPSDVPIYASLQLARASTLAPFDRVPKPPGYERMSLDEVQAWVGQFSEGQRSKAYPQPETNLRVELDDQRAFHVDNVEPGVYALTGVIRYSPIYSKTQADEVIGRLWCEFEVPLLTHESQLDIPLDLGTLAMQPREPKPGDPAPDFDVPTCGPNRLRLKDYHGKVLLVTFYIRLYMDGGSPVMTDLKGLYQRFRVDPRYAQISLVFADDLLLVKKAVEAAGLEWPHGLLPAREGRESTGYGVPGGAPWSVLVGPRGEVLAVGLSGAALTQALEAALRATQ